MNLGICALWSGSRRFTLHDSVRGSRFRPGYWMDWLGLVPRLDQRMRLGLAQSRLVVRLAILVAPLESVLESVGKCSNGRAARS